MNRLKCVFAINVSRRIPSNTTIVAKNHSKKLCRKHSLEICRMPLLKSVHLVLPRTRSFSDFRSFHSTIPIKNETSYVLQRNKSDTISSKKTPLKKNTPTVCPLRRHNSMCQFKKSFNVKRHFLPINKKHADDTKDVRILTIHKKSDSSLEKEPQTYAQIIANYSQTVYTETSSRVFKDGLSMTMINGIHRSPFSTASVVSLKWKNRSKGIKSEHLCVTNPYTFNQKAKFNSDTSATRYERRNDRKDFVIGGSEESKLERSFSSYATMIEKYSNALDVGWSSNLVPKRNVSTRLNDFSMMLTDSKDKSTEFAPSNKSEGITGHSNDTSRKEIGIQDQLEWMAKLEDVIKDLKRITARKEAVDSDTSEKWALQPVNERAEWLDRVVSAHKKNKSTSEKMNENLRPISSTIALPNETRESTMQTANSGKSGSIADYIKRGPPIASSAANTPSQPPTNIVAGQTKQPQIELRMTPSQNESVVSINVDEPAARTTGVGTKDQLSVVISSNRKKVDTTNTNVRSNFDSMQISISENTVPIKQLEFSINGKPVSELKSIVARASKLDVVSSMDKVEIRIPPNENIGMASEQPHLIRANPHSKQVLNLQIAAKFNEPRAQQPKDTGVKTSTTIPPAPTPTTQTPTPRPTPIPTPTQVPPYKPPRMQNLSSTTTTTTATNETPNITNTVIKDQPNTSSVTKKENIITQSSNNSKLLGSNINLPSTNSPQPSTMNEKPSINVPNEDRTPSNTVPWWSSEDSFKNIKKKEGTPEFSDKLTKKVDKDTSIPLEFEQTLNPSIKLVDLQKTEEPAKSASDVADDLQKIETPDEDLLTKSTLKKNEDSSNLSKQIFHTVHVKSPQKLVPIKRGRYVRASKQKKAVNVCRVIKKARFRIKRVKVPIATKKESNVPAVRTPKIIKYVSVHPKTIFVEEKPETTVKAIGPGEQKTELSVEGPKSETTSETSTKIEKDAKDQLQAGKTNVQHSNSVITATKDLKKPGNKSADISAKPSTVSEQGKRNKRHLPSKKEPVGKDQGIKQILKSMKPIEKRKDGTLIDYGVIVPSRTPPAQLSDGKLDSKHEISSQEKIVEPQKVFSTKKETLTEPKTEPQVNIVEPEKISSVKKSIESTNLGIKCEKIESSEKKKQDQKSTILANKDISQTEKHTVSTSVASKTNSSTPASSDKNQPLKTISAKLSNRYSKNLSPEPNLHEKSKIVSSEDSEKLKSILQTINKEKTIKATPSVQPPKIPLKSSDKKIADYFKAAQNRAAGEKQDSKSALKTESKEKEKQKGTPPTPSVKPSKDPVKASDTNKTNSSGSKSLDKPTSQLQSTEKTESKNTLKPKAEGKASLEEIVHPPHTTDKKATRTDHLPLTGTTAAPPSQKLTDKATKNDSKSSAEPIVRSEKKPIDTKMAPFEGTVNYKPAKKQDNLTDSNSTSKEKKVVSEIIAPKKNSISTKLNVPKTSLGKSGGTGSGPTCTPTGPAGLQSSRSFTVSQVCLKMTASCITKESDKVKKDKTPSESKQKRNDELFSNESERPEKDILYSSWLQYFKN